MFNLNAELDELEGPRATRPDKKQQKKFEGDIEVLDRLSNFSTGRLYTGPTSVDPPSPLTCEFFMTSYPKVSE